MIGNFFRRLDSPCESPYVIPCKRGSTPFVSDAVNLMAIGANQDIQEHTADKNYKMNQENNALQQQLAREANEMSESQFQRNMNWLREQFVTNLQREDTKYQRSIADMQAAGVNPALAAGGVSSQVSSVGAPSPSNFHVAQTEAAHFDPYYLDFDALASGISSSVNSYFQNRKTQAETQNVQLDSQTKAINNSTQFIRNIQEINNIMADTEKKLSDKSLSDSTRSYYETQREMLQEQLGILKKQAPALALQPEKNNRVLDSQADEMDSRTALNKIEAQFKPALLAAGIHLSQSQAAAAQGAAAQAWEAAKTYYHTRNEIMPLEKIEHILTNGILSLGFNGTKSYEDFISKENMSDWRNVVKILGELLHNLKPGMK